MEDTSKNSVNAVSTSTCTSKQLLVEQLTSSRLDELEIENARLRKALARVTAVAITTLYENHHEDVKRVFSDEELIAVCDITSDISPLSRVENILKSSWLLISEFAARKKIH